MDTKKIPLIIALLFLLIVIPLTIYLVYQQQIIKKRAAATAVLSLEAVSAQPIGQEFPVDILIDAGAGVEVSFADVRFNFNTSILEVVSVTKSSAFDAEIPISDLPNKFDNTTGRIRLVVRMTESATTFPTGNFVVGTIVFKGKAQGTGEVTLGDSIEIVKRLDGDIFNQGASTGGSYQIGQTGANHPPRITTDSPLPAGTQGLAYTATIQATDDDVGDVITYSWAPTTSNDSLPEGLILNSANGEINGTPLSAGDFNITVTAADNRQGETSKNFTLTIAESPTPLLINFYPYCGPEGMALVIRGVKFGQTRDSNKVTFVNRSNPTLIKDASDTDYLLWTDNLIILKIPANMPGVPLPNGQLDKEARVRVVIGSADYEAPSTPTPKYFNPRGLYQTNVADLNCDGVVNDTDFNVLWQSWTR